MRPGSNACPSSAVTARSAPDRSRMPARTDVPCGAMWRTTAIGAANPASSAPTNWSSASTPPAEAPMTTTRGGGATGPPYPSGGGSLSAVARRAAPARRTFGDLVAVLQRAGPVLPVLQPAADALGGLLAAAPLRRRNEGLPPHGRPFLVHVAFADRPGVAPAVVGERD